MPLYATHRALREIGCGVKDPKAKLPAFAWPGGYPLYYVCADNGVLCPTCVNGDDVRNADADDPQWYVVGVDAHHEGPPMVCDHCGTGIESACGDPDADDADAKKGDKS